MNMHVHTCQQVCAHLLTFAQVCGTHLPTVSMGQNRIRKPKNITFDPDVWDELIAWLDAQPDKINHSRWVETAVVQRLERDKEAAKKGGK